MISILLDDPHRASHCHVLDEIRTVKVILIWTRYE